jgi:DNA-binding IscR family transcriptional regulator
MSRKPNLSLEERVTRVMRLLGMLTSDPQPVGSLARSVGIPTPTLQKICTALVNAGLIRSSRGRFRGGVRIEAGITFDRAQITAIVNSIEPPKPKVRVKKPKPKIGARLQKSEGPLSNRNCRRCKARLPVTRYFDCTVCRPSLNDVNDDMLYAYAPNFIGEDTEALWTAAVEQAPDPATLKQTRTTE